MDTDGSSNKSRIKHRYPIKGGRQENKKSRCLAWFMQLTHLREAELMSLSGPVTIFVKYQYEWSAVHHLYSYLVNSEP